MWQWVMGGVVMVGLAMGRVAMVDVVMVGVVMGDIICIIEWFIPFVIENVLRIYFTSCIIDPRMPINPTHRCF